MTEIEHTDSALNDAFVEFFKTFKHGKEYKYLDMIQGAIQDPHKIIINYANFTPELKGIMASKSKPKIHNAMYRAIGEIFQLKHGFSSMAGFKKNNLFCYEIINNTDIAGEFRKPTAPTKAVMIKTIDKIMRNLPEEERKIDRVHQIFIAESEIGYMEDFSKDGPLYQEIISMIKWHLEETDRKAVQFAVDLLTDKHYFAHIDGRPLKEQHNCYVYRGNRWDRNVQNFTLAELVKYRGMPDFTTSLNMLKETEGKLSVHDKTLQVFLNDENRKLRSGIIIDGSGYYFDLHEGVIRQIDPTQHFYESADVKYELLEDAREPTQFIEMLQTRYGPKNWEIVRDQFAGTFLHINDLGSRAKALILVGPTNTWKSTLIDKFADLFNEDAVTTVTIKQLTTDGFAKSMLANKILNHSQEESDKSMQQAHEVLKDAITGMVNKVRGMWNAKMVPAYRYPRWILATNKLPTIGKDDEDASIFNRFLYIESLPISDKDKVWRDCFNTIREKQEIMMYLLKRACEICSEPTQMKTQTLEETRQIYTELTIGSLSAFLGMTEESRLTSSFKHTGSNTTGVLHLNVWKEYCKYTGSSMSKSKFNALLEDLELDKVRIKCRIIDDGSGNYEKDSEGTHLTLIMGIERKNYSKPTKSTLD